MNDADWERILRASLASEMEPEEKLNQVIIRKLLAHQQLKPRYKRKVSVGLAAVMLMLVLSLSAYAAGQLFSARQVAEQLGDRLLADAFDSKDAILIDQSKDSGGYRFTLHGLVSGENLSEFRQESEDIFPDRTYAVVSIARLDGTPMPRPSEPEYGQDLFFISPLIKGQKPWMVNIATMNGGYSETVMDGVMYRMIECDQVEVFADRGVYLAISSGTSFYSNEAFRFDENTGEVHVREDYSKASLLFDLPLDPAKADRQTAETYLKELLNNSTSTQNTENHEYSGSTGDEAWVRWIEELRAKIRNGEQVGETITDSIKEVTYDASGNITYTYGDLTATISLENLFEEGQTGFTDRRLPISGNGDNYRAMLFHKDENGVITGRIVEIEIE
ncbi:hypothetical protein [Paenibacillus antibioticophila]|uniref:hypothetical protein n=1 Tax=Paenibacillus antibioticophila TaxID=1274374 RepID=UPI0005C9B6A3|nr:hypothetical protein [Paenibacillus antibioticophila]